MIGRIFGMSAIAFARAAQAQAQDATPSSDTSPAAAASPVQPATGSAATPASGDSAGAAPASGSDEIVVTGIRASLATALAQKKSAANIQEDLVADDIGKLPDNNIAESLARLPGLSTNRDRGNATQISIRGMGPELVNTLLNGRELVSAGPDRNIRYDQYPAELINGASVYKSPLPSQVEGAIAGQVDLKTVRPLDFRAPQFVINGRAEYNDLADKQRDAHAFGWIGSASYIGQFADDTLGVALGITARNEPVATRRTNIYRYTNSFADLNGDGTGNDNVPYGFEALQRGGSDKRVGGLATVQWKPDPAFELNGDFFYSRVKYAEYQRGFSVQGLPFGNNFSDVTVVDGGAVAGTATNLEYFGVQLENNNQYYSFTDNLYAGGLNARYNADRLHVAGDFGYSYTKRNAIFLNEYTNAVYPGTTYNRNDGTTVSWASDPGNPSNFSFAQSLTDPTLNYLTNLEIPTGGNGAPIITDELYSGKGDAWYDVGGGFLNTLRAGVRYTTREKNLTQRTQYGSIDPTVRAPISSSLLGNPLDWRNGFSDLPTSMTWNVFGVADQYFGGIHPAESIDDQQSSWEVDEKTYAGYVEADFEHEIAGMQLTGNIGVRVVRTEETSKGAQVSYTSGAAVVTPLTYHNNFTDWLPTLNATLHIDDRQQIRFALSKAIARAALDDLNPSYSLYYNSGSSTPSATGGNPLLQPYRAKQVDLTYEHYFSKDTAATVSLFYKKLGTFIARNVSDLTVDGVTYEDAFTQPVNGHGGNIKGVELLFQQALTFLPKPLDGFGVYTNFSYTDSNVQVNESDNSIGAISLPGLSKYVANATLYYSKYGIDARVGYRYRSSFATQTGDTDRILYNHSEGVLSAEVSYEFPDASALHGLKLTLQGDNLTNTPYQLYYGTKALQGRYEEFGRRIYAGATFRF